MNRLRIPPHRRYAFVKLVGLLLIISLVWLILVALYHATGGGA